MCVNDRLKHLIFWNRGSVIYARLQVYKGMGSILLHISIFLLYPHYELKLLNMKYELLPFSFCMMCCHAMLSG
jgi:hypothetical protein